MSEVAIDELYNHTRILTGKLLIEWLESKKIIDMLVRPETIPAIFYQNKWPDEPKDIVEKIFRYLVSVNIIDEASGTYIKSHYFEKTYEKINEVDLLLLARHPILNFVRYGLKLLDQKYDRDAGMWNLHRDEFIFERGLTQSFYQGLSENLLSLIQNNIEFQVLPNPNTLIFGHYPEKFISSLIDLPVEQLTIVVPNQNLKELAISYCELDNKTSQYSNSVITLDEFNSENNEAFDLIVLANGIGFDLDFKELISFMTKVSIEGTVIYGFAATEPKYYSGIEIFFETHPEYKGIPSTQDFARQLKARGFIDIQRIGPNDLFFVTKYLGD